MEYSTSDDWGHDYDASQVPPAWYVLSVFVHVFVGLLDPFISCHLILRRHAWLHHVHDKPVPHQVRLLSVLALGRPFIFEAVEGQLITARLL